jgi:hypothetical protein
MGHPVGVRRTIDWLFRDRRTGRITIAQFPNAPLAIFLAASLMQRLVHGGRLHAGLEVLVTGALIWWAADEVIRGVNPWRRLLGGAVLAGQIVNLVR